MAMSKSKYLLEVFILLLATSCSLDGNTNVSIETNGAETLATSEVIETVAPVSTATTQPTEEVTIQSPINSVLLENCVEIVDNSDRRFPGILVLHDAILNLATLQLQPLIVPPFDGASLVSPDGGKLAVLSENLEVLLIKNSELEVIYRFPSDNLQPIYWLDNLHLVLQEISFDYYKYGLPSFIMDIKTGSLLEISSGVEQINTYPDNLGKYWNYAYRTRTSINPQVSHLVFPMQDPHQLVIWDIEDNEAVFQFPAFIGTSLPTWDKTGNKFLVSAEADFVETRHIGISYSGNDLFTVDIHGKITRLSYISETTSTYQHYYEWSPDGKNIAFLLEYEEFGMSGFLTDVVPVAILNTQTGQVKDLCITADLPPVWSPDGKYIAISDYLKGVFIIDLFENIAYRVHDPEYWSIHGWMW